MEDLHSVVEKLLKTIPKIRVEYFYPAKFAKLPVVTFYEIANTEGFRADNAEFAQESNFQIDVWADKAKDATRIGDEINAVLLDNGFVRTFAMDVAPNDGIYHRTMRFQIKYFFKE